MNIMGTCCSTTSQQGEELTEINTSDFPAIRNESASRIDDSNAIPPSSFESDFYQRLVRGIDTMVVPATRTGILCTLRFDPKGRRFILRRNQLTRPINIISIQRVMHSPKDLRRVEGQSTMADDENCCALLLKSQSCIFLRFNTRHDNKQFIEMTQDLLLYFSGR